MCVGGVVVVPNGTGKNMPLPHTQGKEFEHLNFRLQNFSISVNEKEKWTKREREKEKKFQLGSSKKKVLSVPESGFGLLLLLFMIGSSVLLLLWLFYLRTIQNIQNC